jgi:hypothetical protein
MKDPILREIRRVRARRSIELGRDVRRAMEESRRRQFTLGLDVVDLSSGKRRVIFKAPRGLDDTSTN